MEMCFGIGHGDIQIMHAGGVFKRVEFFVVGPAVVNALRAFKVTSVSSSNAEAAKKEVNKTIAVSAEVHHLIGEFIICDVHRRNRDEQAI